MDEYIIVGSGPSGTAAALALAGLGFRPRLLDVGYTPDPDTMRVRENLYHYRMRNDSFDLHIGDDFCGLGEILDGRERIVKLTAPFAEFVTRELDGFLPMSTEHFEPVLSFALGGLGNVWGAGLYQFLDYDLAGFPFGAAELTSYFDRLSKEVGISGCDDDLTPFFGSLKDLQPPLRLSRNAHHVLRSYERQRSGFHRKGVYIGRPRLGVLTQKIQDREPVKYQNLEFWQQDTALYTPAYSLNRLISEGKVDYCPGWLVEKWEEDDKGVHLHARHVADRTEKIFSSRKLLLAAGAIGTTKIVLNSYQDYDTRLPLMENPAVQIPFVIPQMIGSPLDIDAFGLTQLNLIFDSAAAGRVQGSLLEITSPMRAEFFRRFPLSSRANLTLIRYLLPAMIVLQIFYAGDTQLPSWLSLGQDGRLHIAGHPNSVDLGTLAPLFGMMRQLGLWTLPALVQKLPLGHGIHYACTLPMKTSPARYECYPDGRLAGTRGVFIVDSAAFSKLPAKNMSFGMMASAMRSAELSAMRQ